ncbi:MAG: hypothetical protein FWG73_09175 [Planctomycetaceae bacterium]|nr:hypothetical protein [Planctomycetaceae bacterium]
MKRFQVSPRFAGLKGPCPNCGGMIEIPNAAVNIQDTDAAKIKAKGEERILTHPIERLGLDFEPIYVKYSILGVFGVLLLAFLIGCIPMYDTVRSLAGVLGLCLVAFPLTLFGYHILRDREQIFAFSGEELYRQAAIVAAGYGILWLVMEFFLTAMQANAMISCVYIAVFAGLASFLAYWQLELQNRDAFLHFCIFGISVILLRFLMGLGWLWQSGALIRHGAAGPPPFLPGM